MQYLFQVLAGIVAGAVQGAPVNPWGIGESSPQQPPLYEDTRIARETLGQETTTPEGRGGGFSLFGIQLNISSGSW